MKLGKYETLNLFFAGTRVEKLDKLIIEIYERNKDKDGFLYIVYSSNETLGWFN